MSWFLPALFLVFLVLKLVNVIDWSWWFVTLPLWVDFGFIALVFIVGFLVTTVREICR